MMRYVLILMLLILFAAIGCASDTVMIVVEAPDGNQVYDVPKDAESLLISHFYTFTDIKGLNLLPKLKTLVFWFMGELSDYSFLEDVPNLEKLRIDKASLKNFDFLLHLPNLKMLLIFDSEIQNYYEIDIVNNNHIELIDICDSSLEYLPRIQNAPESLRYFFLEWNRINKLTDDFISETETIEYISLKHNPVVDWRIAQGLDNRYVVTSYRDVLPSEILELYDSPPKHEIISKDAP